jgi:hypothetical protein
MEIIHQITFKSKSEPKLLQIIQNSGTRMKAIELPNHNGQSISALISETSSIWPLILPFLEKKDVLHSFETTFSEQEILESEWIRIVNVYEQGYPQPEQTWVSNPRNYSDFCMTCGTFKQISPFRIRKEPKLGQNSFMSLIWTGDTLFTTPIVLNVLKEHRIKGFEPWEVIIHKENQPSQMLQQIFIENNSLPGLVKEGNITQKICSVCGKIKYEYHRQGKMLYKRNSLPSDVDIFLSYEWFGSDHMAFREIFISNKLARIIISRKWRGVKMKVVEPV